jgi:hypothetical protein
MHSSSQKTFRLLRLLSPIVWVVAFAVVFLRHSGIFR